MFMDSDDVIFGYGRKVTLEQKQGVLFFVGLGFFFIMQLGRTHTR